MYKLVDGSGSSPADCTTAPAQIPDYDKQDRDQRTEVMADPVQLASKDLHKAPNYGTGFAPYFIPLSLWVGAMVAYMLIPPHEPARARRGCLGLAHRAGGLAAGGRPGGAPDGRADVRTALGDRPGDGAGGRDGGLPVPGDGCFAAIVQWLNARFGAAGRILVLAFLMLQLTSAGGTYPVQTSPGFFNAIHPFMPMSYVVEALGGSSRAAAWDRSGRRAPSSPPSPRAPSR
jgi:putative membrane protein